MIGGLEGWTRDEAIKYLLADMPSHDIGIARSTVFGGGVKGQIYGDDLVNELLAHKVIIMDDHRKARLAEDHEERLSIMRMEDAL